MNKTPFEIRLELLKMAKEALELDYFSEKERLVNDWQTQVNMAQQRNEVHLPKHPIIPPFPTSSDVIEKAKVLNAFVSN